MLCYVSHPYTSDDLQQIKKNIALAEEFGKQLMMQGYTPLIPHKITGLWDMDSRFSHMSQSDWLFHCLKMLDACDIVAFCGNWHKSKGCNIEYQHAKEKKKRIIFIEESIYQPSEAI